MAVGHVLDTNVVLYHLGGRLSKPLGGTRNWVSIVTRLELLSYPDITAAEESHIGDFLSSVTVVGLGPEICRSTVYLRRAYRLKLPDAIICATAMLMNAKLLNDRRFAAVSEIRAEPVPLI